MDYFTCFRNEPLNIYHIGNSGYSTPAISLLYVYFNGFMNIKNIKYTMYLRVVCISCGKESYSLKYLLWFTSFISVSYIPITFKNIVYSNNTNSNMGLPMYGLIRSQYLTMLAIDNINHINGIYLKAKHRCEVY